MRPFRRSSRPRIGTRASCGESSDRDAKFNLELTLRILAPVLRARERELCTRAARSAEALVLGSPRVFLDDVGRDLEAADAVARDYAAIADDAHLGEEVRAMARTVDRRLGETVDAVRRALGGSAPASR